MSSVFFFLKDHPPFSPGKERLDAPIVFFKKEYASHVDAPMPKCLISF